MKYILIDKCENYIWIHFIKVSSNPYYHVNNIKERAVGNYLIQNIWIEE